MILFVDHQSEYVDYYRVVLEEAGHLVVHKDDVDDALSLLEQSDSEIALVLIDAAVKPGLLFGGIVPLDGAGPAILFCRIVRGISPTMPCVILWQRRDTAMERLAASVGNITVCDKESYILAEIREILRANTAHTESFGADRLTRGDLTRVQVPSRDARRLVIAPELA